MTGWSRIRAHRNHGNHRKGGIKKYFREFGELCVGLKTISIAIQEPFPTRNDLDGAMFVADCTFFVKRDNNSAFAWICIGQFAKSVHFACPCGFSRQSSLSEAGATCGLRCRLAVRCRPGKSFERRWKDKSA